MTDTDLGNIKENLKENKEVGEIQPEAAKPHWYEVYVQPCLAELVGTMLFVFVGCLSVINNTANTGTLQPALTHGLAIGLTIAILGGISGGHFNPTVSLGVFIIGGLNVILVVPYWICQLCGGMIGAALAKGLAEEINYEVNAGAAFKIVTNDSQVPRALGAEIVMTFFLMLTVCMGAINKKTKTPLAPFCVCFAVVVNIMAGASVSGACMNPARAFGPAVVANHWAYHWIYWVGPMIGGLLVGGIVRLFFGDPKIRLFLK